MPETRQSGAEIGTVMSIATSTDITLHLLDPNGRIMSSDGAFAALLSRPEYCPVHPQLSVSKGESLEMIVEFILKLQNEGAFSSTASTHPENIIALATTSEGDQQSQMIVELYSVSEFIVEFILASPNKGDKATSTSRAKISALSGLCSSQLIVEYFQCPHCKFASQDMRSRQHRKLPAKLSAGVPTNYNSIVSASNGGNVDMARSISPAPNIPAISSASTSSKEDFAI